MKVVIWPLTTWISLFKYSARSAACAPMSPNAPLPANFFSRRQTSGKFGIHDPVLQIGAVIVVNIADAPIFDQFLGVGDGRHTAIIEIHHVQYTRLLDGLQHLLGLSKIVRQGFLADDVLASLGGGDDHGMMEITGRGDVDHVDVFAFDHPLPFAVGLLPPIQARRLFQLFRAGFAAENFHARYQFSRKESPDLAIGVGMRLAHETVTNQSDINLRHV